MIQIDELPETIDSFSCMWADRSSLSAMSFISYYDEEYSA